jgi:hypothetical protein
VNNLVINQDVKAYIVNGGFVSAELLAQQPEYPLPENVFILKLESTWKYPTISSRKSLVKELEVFDPIKVEITVDNITYKNAFIKHYIQSWSIRGPDIDEGGDASKIEDLPCDLVDIMYQGIMGVSKKAEEELGKV